MLDLVCIVTFFEVLTTHVLTDWPSAPSPRFFIKIHMCVASVVMYNYSTAQRQCYSHSLSITCVAIKSIKQLPVAYVHKFSWFLCLMFINFRCREWKHTICASWHKLLDPLECYMFKTTQARAAVSLSSTTATYS